MECKLISTKHPGFIEPLGAEYYPQLRKLFTEGFGFVEGQRILNLGEPHSVHFPVVSDRIFTTSDPPADRALPFYDIIETERGNQLIPCNTTGAHIYGNTDDNIEIGNRTQPASPESHTADHSRRDSSKDGCRTNEEEPDKIDKHSRSAGTIHVPQSPSDGENDITLASQIEDELANIGNGADIDEEDDNDNNDNKVDGDGDTSGAEDVEKPSETGSDLDANSGTGSGQHYDKPDFDENQSGSSRDSSSDADADASTDEDVDADFVEADFDDAHLGVQQEDQNGEPEDVDMTDGAHPNNNNCAETDVITKDPSPINNSHGNPSADLQMDLDAEGSTDAAKHRDDQCNDQEMDDVPNCQQPITKADHHTPDKTASPPPYEEIDLTRIAEDDNPPNSSTPTSNETEQGMGENSRTALSQFASNMQQLQINAANDEDLNTTDIENLLPSNQTMLSSPPPTPNNHSRTLKGKQKQTLVSHRPLHKGQVLYAEPEPTLPNSNDIFKFRKATQAIKELTNASEREVSLGLRFILALGDTPQDSWRNLVKCVPLLHQCLV